MVTTARMQAQSDDERARDWLKRRLEWEEIFGALRDAGSGSGAAPPAPLPEPAIS